MQYKINLRIQADKAFSLNECIAKKYQLKSFSYQILSKSIDARNKQEVCLVYQLLVDTKEKPKGRGIEPYHKEKVSIDYPIWKGVAPVIVGFGPAGMFAALYLARCKANPIIIERGSRIEQRVQEVEKFLKTKVIEPNSNVQFGEGGAGAFSDGKLTTNVKNPYVRFIFEEFYKHGAKEDILYDSMPHIGTDVLREVVKNIRTEIEGLGGKFYFNTTFEDAKEEDEQICVFAGNHVFRTKHLLLGLGHSARDTIRHLYQDMQLAMEPKAFSMGVRVEHLASKMDRAQYGRYAKFLPRAYYKLSCHLEDRGVYTFCMCPGGYVIASASSENSIVTNGMSNQAREGENSNSAILVDVKPKDYGTGVLDGLAYQEKYERLAFEIAKDYRAPANLMKEFLDDEIAAEERSVHSSYPHGILMSDLRRCLPDFVVQGIKAGILNFDQKLHGFYDPDAILIGIESRSSSPVRILRNEQRVSSNPFIYPIGEGAGYAGGIVSAALDGLLTAMKIVGETSE